MKETDITTQMRADGVHVFVNDELALIVENDPDELIIRTPSDGFAGSSHLMFSVDEAVEEVFGALDRQQKLGLNVILSVCIFSQFEEQDKFVNRISQ